MLSRRSFLNSTLGAGLALATRNGGGADGGRPTRAKRMIVDAQVHLWKAESPDWPWVPGSAAAAARAVHHREARADDGRGRRRSRRHRAAVMAGRPQRLCARGRQAISRPLRRHGPHPAEKPAIGGAAAEMEGAAGHARRPGDVHRARRRLAHRRHRRLVLAGGREGRASRSCFSRRPGAGSSPASPSATRS